jgi:hypothetical protein
MALELRYKPEYRDVVIDALQVMLDNLGTKLQIQDGVSLYLDTREEYQTLNEAMRIGLTEEQISESVQAGRDRSALLLGHIQRRIAEVKVLKEAFELPTSPSQCILNQAYTAIRSSLLYEAMNLALCCPVKSIITAGVSGLGKTKVKEVHRLGDTVEAYSKALMCGFGLSPIFWSEFPFDEA